MKYDIDYYLNLLRIHTATAKQINDLRWNFLSEHINIKKPTVLDYGCGVGWFAAFKPVGAIVDTFDIMPVPQTGIKHEHYDILTLWDVLEHIPDFTELKPILNICDYVALTIPMKPKDKEWNEWKHFKPSEHLHYYDKELLCAMFKVFHFNLKISDMRECPPRADVHSFIFAVEGVE